MFTQADIRRRTRLFAIMADEWLLCDLAIDKAYCILWGSFFEGEPRASSWLVSFLCDSALKVRRTADFRGCGYNVMKIESIIMLCINVYE